jgi:hypothetical protein
MDNNVIPLRTEADREWRRYWLALLTAFPEARGTINALEEGCRSVPPKEEDTRTRRPRRVKKPGEF